MVEYKYNSIYSLMLALLLVILIPSLSMAKPVATLTFVRGVVDVLKPDEERARPAKKGDELDVGDIIRTKSRSRAQVTFIDGSKVNIAQKSRIEIKAFSLDPKKKRRSSLLRSFRGKLRALIPKAFLGEGSRFEIETPTAVAAVRGTDFFSIIKKLPLESEVLVVKGEVGVRNIDPAILGEVLLKAGQSTKVARGLPPIKPRLFTLKEMKRHMRETEPDEREPVPSGKLTESLLKTPKKTAPPVTPPITEIETLAPVDVIIDFPLSQ